MAKNKRMVFNKAREIEKERDGAATKRDNLEKRAKDAKAQLELSKKKYEDELKKGVQAGEDNTEKLNELADEIDQKEKLAARRANEAAIGRQHFQTTTDKDEIKKSFREWKREYENKEIKPELEKIRKIKAELSDAYESYKDATNHYEREKETAQSLMDPNGGVVFNPLGSVGPMTRQEKDYYLITVNTLTDLEKGRKPNGVEGGAK
ncbi:conserved hypothetical protein (plasmid) [Halobacillus halophilus DSM 2266]|uniref:Uncharacterized protein n=2 Tax=Halobacillus halophilus TaxID=1570 RepID=I0JTN8_HALH3|nr:hypothetical protein [Halobacillus halophilus]CCG47511.1 conserved hypothetical protein [Halobacillus halophilus DSM 2266]